MFFLSVLIAFTLIAIFSDRRIQSDQIGVFAFIALILDILFLMIVGEWLLQ